MLLNIWIFRKEKKRKKIKRLGLIILLLLKSKNNSIDIPEFSPIVFSVVFN